MKLHPEILRSMLFCNYKAWQLSRQENVATTSFDADNLIRINNASITANDKLITVAYFLFEKNGKVLPRENISVEYGFPDDKKKTRISVSQYRDRAQKLLNQTETMVNSQVSPAFYNNKHCPECCFRDSCLEKLKERECISLLGGVTHKVLSKYHRKGIFSITQLSHTFRPRRRGRRPHVAGSSFLWDLKALAIRDGKTYVMHPPDLTKDTVTFFMDFEGMGTDQYLVGLVMRETGKADVEYSFWSETDGDEKSIFSKMFSLLEKYPESPVYHYGSYESKALKHIAKKWPADFRKQSQELSKRMVNILGYLRTHIYPPIYSNGLKELANFLGFRWKDNDMDGITSIEIRKQWLSEKQDLLKEKLIGYNLDDCRALCVVKDWFDSLSDNVGSDSIKKVAEMKKVSPYKFHDNPEFGEDFVRITKAAYFDYQRMKIYLRGDKPHTIPKKAVKDSDRVGKGIQKWQPKKIHETVTAPITQQCPNCGNTKLYRLNRNTARKQTDLKFTSGGIKQWTTEYRTGQWTCSKCRLRLTDERVRLLQYGDNLFAWAVNLYVNYYMSYDQIARMLNEQFGIWMNKMYLLQRKHKWIRTWQPEINYIKETVLNSPVIHIDETKIRLSKDSGYVWVFATMHTVFYHFTFTRDAVFISELLKDYKGVIVTDFFPSYDTLDVKRQKCLIHLIRDMNDDLFKNPFDTEYAVMVKEFGELLRKIVETMDRKGLQSKFLQRHLNDVGTYFKKHVDTEHKSELSVKYSKRLDKHWDEMWTFLEYDGIPWNNNNAEAAIKSFAQFRHRVNGQISLKGLDEYLRMLSVSQTCRYRNISFLDFLRKKSGIWENIHPQALPGYIPYNQAKLYVSKQRLKSENEWRQWKSSNKRPSFIPEFPEKIYDGKGWNSFLEWVSH